MLLNNKAHGKKSQ